ncbi:MAG TPA: hypothetical protein VEW46_24480 [Pyrinomonadaceae bacterium]|nr:hypothetical protein [Pyrinomonadaceae bacterium]
MPFSVTSDLSSVFVAPDAAQATRLWPLDFMILRAFSSRPEFLTNGQDPDTYADRNPWQFGELRGEIATKVSNKIDSDARIKAFYQDLRDFTLLQRLFRVVLENEVWKQFPIEKLVDLTKATAGSYEYVPTARWDNPSRGSLRPAVFEP